MTSLSKTLLNTQLPGLLTLLLASVSITSNANEFTLTSEDIAEGEMMPKTQEFQGFGCSGGNLSPQLTWSGAPEGTEAFAITVYDPDAPTGSGWWHWQIVNIPANVNILAAGAIAPEGSVQIKNDYGVAAFGGACPPPGHGVHRYQFTVHALSQKLERPEDPSGALAGYLINAHSLGSATVEALYKRD